MFVSLFRELNLVSLPKKLLNKVLFVLLLASSSIANALTLGDFVVDSFLDKPLKAEIVVNGNSGDNLNTLEISMASEEEFKQAGIVRVSSLDNFNFELVKDSKSKAKILIVTENSISDPYIHMLLKIRWNGGQLLREFTALIDPPLYSSQPAEKVNTAKTSKQKEADLREELKAVDQNDDKNVVTTAPPASVPSTSSLPGSTYGPVQAGESLSQIAQKIQQDNPDLSIYQIMYVLFQNNQSAFIDKNINGLAKGSTLQVGDLNAIATIDKQEGINFFYTQLAQWSAQQESQTSESSDDVETASDAQESSGASSDENTNSSDPSQEASSSESSESASETTDSDSKPEFQVAASDVQSGAQQSGEVNSQVVTGLKTQVAELEASVESSKLESEELKETISILENQLADSNRLIELNNQELASLAASANKEPENDALVATTIEEIPEEVESEQIEVVTPEVIEPEVVVSEAVEPEITVPDAVEPEVVTPEVIEEPKVESIVPEIESAPVSFLDGVISKIKELWLFIAIALAGLLGLLLLKMRSSKKEDDSDLFESTFTVYPEDTASIGDEENTSDAKAEELINAIKAETIRPAQEAAVANTAVNEDEASVDGSVVSSIDMDALREATQSVTDFEVDSAESGEMSKESSFLTVYNDGDVVVNADEIDPIAEADVYIAYGREDQGEEVLLDGVKNFPDRNDIKIALLGLYAKSSKREKFDDMYKGLIAGGIENNIEEWQSVEELKKTIDAKLIGGPSPDNFDALLTSSTKPVNVNDLSLGEEVSNTDFIVNSEVDDLSEIDIKSESFEISEIDFSTDIGNDVPVLNAGVEIGDLDNISLDNEITIEVESDSGIGLDDGIESITIQVEPISDVSVADEDLDKVVGSLGDVDFTTDRKLGDAAESIKKTVAQEMSEVDFSDDLITAENSLQIDLDNSVSLDEVDISAEISEVSYNDEVSLTDVMELNMTDIDLASIPDEQDLTPVKDMTATTLMNDVDVDFVNEITIDDEITVDLTEAMEFNDGDGDEFGGIDLDLGINESSSNDQALPDGNNDPETQLDLAKVFLELDDVPGAVKILKELVDNKKVGTKAKELLSKHS